ncbi:MAG TPA: hypothetical protein VFQ61_03200 [Polyangiaceae bacterium]|nr:hypothetical protein [Polyangiaceae bacterium]
MKNLVFGLGVLLICLMAPARAEAKGIPVVYNTGQEVFETGPLPAPFDKASELEGYKAGYLCDITGVLWSYFSVRNCKPVAYKDTSYSDDAEIVKAISATYTEADMKRGIWGHFGWMLMAGLVALGVLVWIYEAVTGKSSDDNEEASSSRQA